jgi:hypothetical protein
MRAMISIGLLGTTLLITGCTPTVRVEVPDRPIEINLNINLKIEGDVRVRMEEAAQAIQARPDLF